jgi:Fe-S-cluster containining protein
MLSGSAPLRFRCEQGIACWNACCSNIDLALTPWDILRLKTRLELSSTEFLTRHTLPYELEKDGIAGVKLKPVAGGTACPFMRAEGCGVYEDRPTACRYYPLALLSLRRENAIQDEASYALVRESHCLGHGRGAAREIDAYREEQGCPQADAAAHGWRQLILKKKSLGPAIGKPSRRSLELFFMVCYDLDRFRPFVASDGFLASYELPDEELRGLLTDDAVLLQFGFRLLKQVLFGEMSIPMREGAIDARRERVRDQAARIEREAALRRARDEGELEEAGDE